MPWISADSSAERSIAVSCTESYPAGGWVVASLVSCFKRKRTFSCPIPHPKLRIPCSTTGDRLGAHFLHLRPGQSFSHSVVSNSAAPWTAARQTPLSIGFPRQEHWSAISFSRGSSQPRDQAWVSCNADRFFTIWATGEALELGKHHTLELFPWQGPKGWCFRREAAGRGWWRPQGVKLIQSEWAHAVSGLSHKLRGRPPQWLRG